MLCPVCEARLINKALVFRCSKQPAVVLALPKTRGRRRQSGPVRILLLHVCCRRMALVNFPSDLCLSSYCTAFLLLQSRAVRVSVAPRPVAFVPNQAAAPQQVALHAPLVAQLLRESLSVFEVRVAGVHVAGRRWHRQRAVDHLDLQPVSACNM